MTFSPMDSDVQSPDDAPLREAGFSSVKIVRERAVDVPDEVLAEAASTEEIQRFRENGGLLSVTVRGRKP